MFWSRRPRPPLTTLQRVNLELLMRRTLEVIGKDNVRKFPIVIDLQSLSLDATTPQRLLHSASTAVLDRLPPIHQRIDLATSSLEELKFPAICELGHDKTPARITVAVEILADPLRTAMELAYQYANIFWAHVEKPMPLDTDPRTIHLLPICCGLGVLASDASLCDQQWSRNGYYGWSITRCGYYTAAEIGYALALLARFLGGDTTPWVGRLRPDSRVPFNQAMRYFDHQRRAGQRLLFDADQIPTSSSDQKQLADWLSGDDPSYALAACHALCRQANLSTQAIESAVGATYSPDPDLPPVAAKLLGLGRLDSQAARQRTEELIRDRAPATAMAALQSAQALGLPLNQHRDRIAQLLEQFSGESFSILEVVGQQGREFASFEPQICVHLTRAIQASDDELATALIECLRRIAEDPRRAIENRIWPEETRQDAFRRLEGGD